jgi:hypothetical protein
VSGPYDLSVALLPEQMQFLLLIGYNLALVTHYKKKTVTLVSQFAILPIKACVGCNIKGMIKAYAFTACNFLHFSDIYPFVQQKSTQETF